MADALPDDIGALRALILAERVERAQLAERNAILERLTSKLAHIVAELKRAQFGRKADIVLPKTTTLEEAEVSFMPSGPTVLFTRAVVPPQGEARSEIDIALPLLAKMAERQAINPDHARQQEVWEALQRSPIREPYQIRRLLTQDAVRASDKRAQFVGLADYEAAGGIVLRDLFEADDGGWLQDPALLERLVAEKLEREAEAVRAEGWKWAEVAPEFPTATPTGCAASAAPRWP